MRRFSTHEHLCDSHIALLLSEWRLLMASNWEWIKRNKHGPNFHELYSNPFLHHLSENKSIKLKDYLSCVFGGWRYTVHQSMDVRLTDNLIPPSRRRSKKDVDAPQRIHISSSTCIDLNLRPRWPVLSRYSFFDWQLAPMICLTSTASPVSNKSRFSFIAWRCFTNVSVNWLILSGLRSREEAAACMLWNSCSQGYNVRRGSESSLQNLFQA